MRPRSLPLPAQLSVHTDAPKSNFHGDAVVNNGILELIHWGAIRPNSACRLNTTQGKPRLDYPGMAKVRQFWIDNVQEPKGTYGIADKTVTSSTDAGQMCYRVQS